MRAFLSALSSLVVVSGLTFAVGCTVTESSTSPTADAGATGEGGAGGDAGDGGVARLDFTPTNLASVDASGNLADVVLQDCGAQIRATDTGRLACLGQDEGERPFRYSTVTQPDGTKIKVFLVNSLRIPSGVTAEITAGDDPIAIIALDTIEIEGSLAVASIVTAGGYREANAAQNGNGPGGGKVATSGQGDGGGGYCGKGGAGGGPGAGEGGATYGNPEISPLLGGSAGGGQFAGNGGGAIQLVAKNLIRVSPGGSINVGGRGSDTGGAGAGGAILLESKEIVIAGKLAANGGGGGAGTGPNDGKDGQLESTPTPEGTGDPTNGGGGGKGGAGATVDGQPGVINATYPDGAFAGNGGGGAGRIRINTASGRATITGLVSPEASTGCASEGTIGGPR